MKIHTITVTGADDSVSPSDLLTLAEEFPCLEFGILLSRNSMGRSRFPSAEWLRKLVELPRTVKLSGHFCGAWVSEILMGHWPTLELMPVLGSGFLQRFSRFQLNTHGLRHKWSPLFIEKLDVLPATVIFQYDGKNNDVVAAALEEGHKNIAALFDLSHGAGALPEAWPSILNGIDCGYAGGLSPENVAGECRRIESVSGGASIWIDAETHLREPERQFDLEKVRRFVSNALPWT